MVLLLRGAAEKLPPELGPLKNLRRRHPLARSAHLVFIITLQGCFSRRRGAAFLRPKCRGRGVIVLTIIITLTAAKGRAGHSFVPLDPLARRAPFAQSVRFC